MAIEGPIIGPASIFTSILGAKGGGVKQVLGLPENVKFGQVIGTGGPATYAAAIQPGQRTATRKDAEGGGMGTGRGTAGQQGGGGIGSRGGQPPSRQRGGPFPIPTEGPLARIWEYIVGIAGGTAVYDILRRVLEEFGGETPEEKARREREERERAMGRVEGEMRTIERGIERARARGRELEREAKEAAAATRKRLAEADKRMREEIAKAERERRERLERFVKIGAAVLTAGTAVYTASAAKAATRASVAGGPAAVPPTPRPPTPTPPPPTPQLGFAGPITGFGAPSAAQLGIDVGIATPTALAAGQGVVTCETVKTRSKKKRGRCRAGFFQEFTDATRYVTWREAPCRPQSPFSNARGFFA